MKKKLNGHHGDLGISNKLFEYNIIYSIDETRIYNLTVKVHNYIDALLIFEKRKNINNCKLIDITRIYS